MVDGKVLSEHRVKVEVRVHRDTGEFGLLRLLTVLEHHIRPPLLWL